MAALARAEILRPEPPPGFVHPLVRDAVYHGLPLGERELLHARAAERPARLGASLDQVAGQLMHTPAPRRRGGRAAAARGRQRGAGAAARSTTPSATCSARWTSRAPADDPRRSCCSTSARSRRSSRGPEAAEHLREAYEGLTDVAAADPRRQRARARAAVHHLAGRGRRGRARGRRRAAAGAGRRGARRCEAFALMGVPFGALDPAEMRARAARTARPAADDARREDDGRGGRARVDAQRRARRRGRRARAARARGRRAAERTTRTC